MPPRAGVTDIVGRRLAVQRLIGPGLKRASNVVRELVAVQSQDFAGAKWALSQRTKGVTDAEVEAEFTRGAMLRTHVLRPTWHFVAPEDLRWLLALTGPRVNALMAQYDRRLGLTAAVYRRSQAVIEKALAGKHLTRTELGTALERGKIRHKLQALAHLMMRAELNGVVTSGPRRGKQFTYALLEERVKPAPAKDRDEALLELTRRYFATRGPATVQDCAWWSGLTVADVKRGLQAAGRALHKEEIDGREYWSAAGARDLPKAPPSAHLLPNYDEYFIGYKDRSAIGQRLGSVKRVMGGNALIAHVVCVDGQLVGGWKRVVRKKGTDVALDLVVRLDKSERARVEAAVERFRAFVS